MAHNPDALKTSPEQYLERAKIIRRQVETMNNADVRRQLLDIAERYEELADGIERPQSLAVPFKPAQHTRPGRWQN
jgi:hypothetical protein